MCDRPENKILIIYREVSQMTVFDILTELQEKAFHDEKIRQELLETRQA